MEKSRRPRSTSLTLREYQLLRSHQEEVGATYYILCWGSFCLLLTTIVYIIIVSSDT